MFEPEDLKGCLCLLDLALPISAPSFDLFTCLQVEGVEMLARMLHPDVVQQRCPEGSALKLALQGGQRCRQRLVPNYFLPFQ